MKKSPKITISPPERDFTKFLEAQRIRVEERLSLWGDMPHVNRKNACAQDWQHILTDAIGDLFEQFRYDESDPEVNKAVFKRLAMIGAIVDEWAKALEEAE